MEIEITTRLMIDDNLIADDVTVTIDASFREFMNASGDHDFELEDWDIIGVCWESPITRLEARVEYPAHDFRKTSQQKQLDDEHRRKVRGMLESLRTFIPLSHDQIVVKLVDAYKEQRS